MDNMNLTDLILVGVPEVALAFSFGLSTIRGGRILKNFKTLLKILISSIGILVVIYFSRKTFSNIVISTLINMIPYIICYKTLFRFNWRQSIVSGTLVVFSVIALEIFTFPIMDYLTTKYFEGSIFYSNRFILTIPTRILQLLGIVFSEKILKLKNSQLINEEWNVLTKSKRKTIIILIILMVMCIIFNINYTDIFMRLNVQRVNISTISNNLQIYFFETILFMVILITILNRTLLYEKYKTILNDSPENFVNKIFQGSSYKELYSFARILYNEIQIVKYEKLNEGLDSIKKYYENFYYNLDNKVIVYDIDYMIFIHFIDFLVKFFYKNLNYRDVVNCMLKEEDKTIKINIYFDKVSEFQFNSFCKRIKTEKTFKQFKIEIFNKYMSKINIKQSKEGLNIDLNIEINKINFREEL